jgi:hypothetical protein
VPGFRLPALNAALAHTRAYTDRPTSATYFGGLYDFITRPYVTVEETQLERFGAAKPGVIEQCRAEWSRSTVIRHEVDHHGRPRMSPPGTPVAGGDASADASVDAAEAAAAEPVSSSVRSRKARRE